MILEILLNTTKSHWNVGRDNRNYIDGRTLRDFYCIKQQRNKSYNTHT